MGKYYIIFISILSVFIFLSCGTESTPTYILSTSVVGEGTISPAGGTYEEGEVVTLTANPTVHWVFDNWSEDGSGSSNTVTITMDSDKNVVGNFSERLYPLNITVVGEGTVTEEVIQSKSEHTFGTVVQLTPVPENGWKFVEWSGDLSGDVNLIQITITGEKNVTVTFERIDYPLTITIEGEGEVEQEVVQSKTTEYPFETVVQLTSKPNDGWVFIQWKDDLSGDNNPETIEVDTDKEVTSVFKSIEELLTIDISGQGTVDIQQESFKENPSRRKVTLTHNSSQNWKFLEWSGDISYTEDVINVTIDRETNITAAFEEAWAIDTETEIVEVLSPTGRIWMDRNLGASRAAISSRDEHAYGDIYQWGRAADGHQKLNSPNTSILSSIDQPIHRSFIKPQDSPWDWRTPQNDELWQGLKGINNPCPIGYRLPTSDEWNAELRSWKGRNVDGAFDSPLKLPAASYRLIPRGSGAISGSLGWHYWSSDVSSVRIFDNRAEFLYFDTHDARVKWYYRASGFSVRCIKD